MLTHRVPYPPDRGDRIRAYHLLAALATRCRVTLAAIADEPVAPETLAHLASLCQQVHLAKARPIRQRAAAAHALLTGQAITPAMLYDRTLAKRLVHLHQLKPFDAVLTYCTGMIGYAKRLLEQPNAPRHILDLVDVDSQKWARYAEQTQGPMKCVYRAEARRLRAVEAGQVVPFDQITLISQAEAQRYQQHVSTNHRPVIVGNGVDLQRFHPAHEPADQPVIIFTGVMSYKPNIDAAAWFARQVMPRIRSAVTDAQFNIVGKAPTPAIKALDELPGVRVVGPVDDTAAWLRKADLAVAPLRIAPGVQNKVLEAMACALPVVCSPQAASGIDAKPGKHLLVAQDASDFAMQCVRLLQQPQARQQIGNAARKRIEERYDWPSATAPMLDLFNLKPNGSTQHANARCASHQ